MKYHNYPSLKGSSDVDALWRGRRSGDIATVATDELCTSYAVKAVGSRINNVTGGNVGIEPRMALIYTELVGRRKFGLKRFVEVTATNAAKIFGLYPRKGVIRVGSDADLVVLDPSGRTITAKMLHESDYTPWEGWRTDAWPTVTLLRGKIVVDGDHFLGSPKDGGLLRRKL
jgi:dihydropyrimidinase